MNKPLAWSYSALDSFETCGWRHYLTKVTKEVVEPQTDALRHGNAVHKALENRLLGQGALPSNLAHYEPYAQRVLRSALGGQLHAEQKLALNNRMQQTTYFAKDVWVRVITDFTVITKRKDGDGHKAFIGDWKTGARKPDSAQLRLSAAATFACFPHVNLIHNSFFWLKEDKVDSEVFTREDVPTIWQEFMPRVQRLEIAHAEQKWPKRPSGLCRKWCPVPRAKCEHSGG